MKNTPFKEEYEYEDDTIAVKEHQQKELVESTLVKPSYTNQKKIKINIPLPFLKKKEPKPIDLNAKSKTLERIFLAVALFFITIWAMGNAFNSLNINPNALREAFLKGLGFEGTTQFNSVVDELNAPFTPEIIAELPENFKLFNNEVLAPLSNNEFTVKLLGITSGNRFVLELTITSIKAEGKKIGLTLPEKLYISFNFTPGVNKLDNIKINNVSSDAQNTLNSVLSLHQMGIEYANMYNTWLAEKSL